MHSCSGSAPLGSPIPSSKTFVHLTLSLVTVLRISHRRGLIVRRGEDRGRNYTAHKSNIPLQKPDSLPACQMSRSQIRSSCSKHRCHIAITRVRIFASLTHYPCNELLHVMVRGKWRETGDWLFSFHGGLHRLRWGLVAASSPRCGTKPPIPWAVFPNVSSASSKSTLPPQCQRS